MTYSSTSLGEVHLGDCLELLRKLESDSVALVVTSPPYKDRKLYGNGKAFGRLWYKTEFMTIAKEVKRVLAPNGSLVLNYRSGRDGSERGTLQFELVGWLREIGFLFAEDFIWGKPSPPPGRYRRFLKDAIEYCFQFTKSENWQFFPEQVLQTAKWDKLDRQRRLLKSHNHVRETSPSGHARKRAQAGPEWVRPSNLLLFEPDFSPNPTKHPCRFPIQIPSFFIQLLTMEGQLVVDPFAGTCTTAVAAEVLGRRWMALETEEDYLNGVKKRIESASGSTRDDLSRL